MSAAQSDTLALAGGQVIDGLGHDPVARGVVVIENGRISAAGPSASVRIPRGARVMDVSGCAVMPGIIDCHVHATYRARDVRRHLLNSPTYNVLASTRILAETLACGVTTARDMGGADAGFRAALDEGIISGPRLLISVVMISQTGGHGDAWVPAGLRIPKRTWLPSGVADGVDEVRRLVRTLLMAGADFIKICATGGITSLTDNWDEPQYTVEEIAAAVSEAAAKRKRVAAHAEGLEGIRLVLDAGVYSIEHGWFMDEQCADAMIKRGTWWVPTLALVPRSLQRRKADAVWSGQQLAAEDSKEEAVFSKMREQAPLWKDAVRRGLKVAMGTDQSHRLMVGENLVELEYMVEWLGMSPMEAIVASTSRAAQCIERPDRGALAPGRIADILVVNGDPLADIRVIQERDRIEAVIKGGKTVAGTRAGA
jgi:imidazolonepropionase-like amidohydrolase